MRFREGFRPGITLTSSLLTIFLFGISGVQYFEVIAMAKASIATIFALVGILTFCWNSPKVWVCNHL